MTAVAQKDYSKEYLFISDIHLSSENQQIANKFIDFLNNRARRANALYILGDLFEYWIGDDDQTNFNQKIITALRCLSDSGVSVYVMHGNHDFLIGENFSHASNCQLINDPYCINLYGTKTLLMHGDLLCTNDTKYQRYRRKVHSPLLKKLFLSLPIVLRRYIAYKMHNASNKRLSTLAYNIMDVTPDEVKKVMQHYQTKLLIHGHTHRPAIHQLENNKVRIVLAAWHDQGNALVCRQNDHNQLEYELIYF